MKILRSHSSAVSLLREGRGKGEKRGEISLIPGWSPMVCKRKKGTGTRTPSSSIPFPFSSPSQRLRRRRQLHREAKKKEKKRPHGRFPSPHSFFSPPGMTSFFFLNKSLIPDGRKKKAAAGRPAAANLWAQDLGLAAAFFSLRRCCPPGLIHHAQ